MYYEGSKWRLWLSVALIATGLLFLIVALVKQSVVLAILGVISMAIGSATPSQSRPWQGESIGPSSEPPEQFTATDDSANRAPVEDPQQH